jgi:hypothetical protein
MRTTDNKRDEWNWREDIICEAIYTFTETTDELQRTAGRGHHDADYICSCCNESFLFLCSKMLTTIWLKLELFYFGLENRN